MYRRHSHLDLYEVSNEVKQGDVTTQLMDIYIDILLIKRKQLDLVCLYTPLPEVSFIEWTSGFYK